MHYGTSSSRKRHDHARRQSSNTAIASFARGVHRTWLAEDGSDKAPVEVQRRAMGELLGNAVKINA